MTEESDNKPERRGSAPKPPEQKPPADPVSPDVTMTPKEHALATGNGPKKQRNAWTGKGFSRLMGSLEHETAKSLHGWDDHEHETGAPIQLKRADYLAALAATHPADPIDKDGKPILDETTKLPKLAGNPVPHPAALSPYKGKRGALKLGEKPEQAKA